MQKIKNIVIKDARLSFRNFAGRESMYNAKGTRNFGVIIDMEDAEELKEEGWNIKIRKAKNDGEEDIAYLKVRVNYNGPYPPQVYTITSKKKTLLTEKNIASLDSADIKLARLEIVPSVWKSKINQAEGITAYLKVGYFEIVEDPFYDLYSKYDEPDGSVSPDDEIPFE